MGATQTKPEMTRQPPTKCSFLSFRVTYDMYTESLVFSDDTQRDDSESWTHQDVVVSVG